MPCDEGPDDVDFDEYLDDYDEDEDRFEEDYDDDVYSDELEELEEAIQNCSKMADGSCGQAGSEYCDFECPFRED